MFSTLRSITRRGWIKVWIIYLLLVGSFVGGLMGFLYTFTMLPYPQDASVEGRMRETYEPTADFPTILHHSWKDDAIPAMWQGAYNACLSLNKGYTFMLWTDEKIEQFMDEQYPWFKPEFDSYKYKIQKIDVFRYFILYHYGGIYIDLDIQCKYPFSMILANVSTDHGMLLPETWPVGISNEFIVAKRHHPFFPFLVSRLHAAHHEYGLHYFTVMASTGPMFVSRCLATYPDRRDVFQLPIRLHKWHYFDHVDGDSWQWWDMWIINWWVSWLIALVLLFLATAMCVARCCRHNRSTAVAAASKGEKLRTSGGGGGGAKYHRLGNGEVP